MKIVAAFASTSSTSETATRTRSAGWPAGQRSGSTRHRIVRSDTAPDGSGAGAGPESDLRPRRMSISLAGGQGRSIRLDQLRNREDLIGIYEIGIADQFAVRPVDQAVAKPLPIMLLRDPPEIVTPLDDDRAVAH